MIRLGRWEDRFAVGLHFMEGEGERFSKDCAGESYGKGANNELSDHNSVCFVAVLVLILQAGVERRKNERQCGFFKS
jgi:hypothetical protein